MIEVRPIHEASGHGQQKRAERLAQLGHVERRAQVLARNGRGMLARGGHLAASGA